jgi:membrane protease YdiL (CAAX protease family)
MSFMVVTTGCDMNNKKVFSTPVILLIAVTFCASAFILFLKVGLWEGVREGFVGGILAAVWIFAAKLILADEPIPNQFQIKRPFLELCLMTLILAFMVAYAALGYSGILEIPRLVYLLLSVGLVVFIHLASKYKLEVLGLRMPSRRAWLALVAIVLLNVFFAFIYRQLPAGEAPTPQGADLAEEISGPLSVLVLLGSILLIAALPEELVLRVGFQPRLAAFMGIGLAIVVQALLFSMGHVPQQMLRYERSPLIALAYVLPIENGLIAGYMWYRTKSLPLLLLLHLFAFPRFGR